MDIRPALASDLPAITRIYNHYVENSHATFDVGAFSVEDRTPWFDQFDGGRYQCWVAEDGGELLGYACSMPFKAKAAYQTSAEVSVYVAAEAHRRGVGGALYHQLLPSLEAEDLHRAYAGISQPNEPSMALHAAHGFVQAAHYREVGRKFDRYWDVIWLERAL
ncbi:MAG: N-acetyltransferase family protein [Gammaproteobacteria bacterium]|jgi:phosphinothricin acetyltransferase|nr:MAG: N-acetyltransferase family protein [Gammaproteobacteria bacterium]